MIIDTNVVLDVLLDREPFVKPAVEVFCLAGESRIEAFICGTTVTTIDDLLMKSLPKSKARKDKSKSIYHPIYRRKLILFFNDSFFWAFVSMFGLVGCGAVVSGSKLGKYPLFGAIVVIIFDFGRIVLVLPVCEQPRFEFSGLHMFVGGAIFIIGILFCASALSIKPITAPDKTTKLKTNGLYGIVRNPIYTGEILWCLGLAICFRSIIGVALVPIWWIALLFHIAKEEESLERELGETYQNYKKIVKGRIIPGLPI